MMTLSCHCGAVRIEVRSRPEFLHECNCTLCSKAGARWGYFGPDEIAVEGRTAGYSRTDKAEPGVAVHFCPTCGSTTHFRLTPAAIAQHGDVQMGVNMRLAADEDLAGVELRFPDGRRWSGTGSFSYVREPDIIGG
ncbi:MAG TPA: aldehyde-activating protein [Polymorphobacter sp.]|nr:aldehyde-activating protein [Polymorphobacter sp.]